MAETENLTLRVQLMQPSVQSLFLAQRWQKYKGNLFNQVQMELILSLIHSKKGNLQVCRLWVFLRDSFSYSTSLECQTLQKGLKIKNIAPLA